MIEEITDEDVIENERLNHDKLKYICVLLESVLGEDMDFVLSVIDAKDMPHDGKNHQCQGALLTNLSPCNALTVMQSTVERFEARVVKH